MEITIKEDKPYIKLKWQNSHLWLCKKPRYGHEYSQ